MPITNFYYPEDENEEKKPLFRPKINWIKIILILLLCEIITGGLSTGFYFLLTNTFNINNAYIYSTILFIILNILLIVIFFGKIIICLTRIYQRYAKEEIRRRCVYTPSCSEYMILSIQKYGGFKGFAKGIKRLNRCHPPHEGEDLP